MAKLIVKQGERYGRLIIVRELEPKRNKWGKSPRVFECLCDCGKVHKALLGSMRVGHTKSCGCYSQECRYENTKTHGQCSHPAFSRYDNMMQRVRPDTRDAHRYFDRGIVVCEEWSGNPEAFCKWADETGFSRRMELDRRDNSKGYSPENCRWVSRKANMQNCSHSYWWHCDGAIFGSRHDAADTIGVDPSTIFLRAKSPNFPNYFKVKKYL